jgi:hypothetical protein
MMWNLFPVLLDQIDLPVTFEDPDTDYDLVDFGGNASSIVVDPTDPTNTVAQSIKTDAAVVFAGTTMGSMVLPIRFLLPVMLLRCVSASGHPMPTFRFD